jgi:hypothetical protein
VSQHKGFERGEGDKQIQFFFSFLGWNMRETRNMWHWQVVVPTYYEVKPPQFEAERSSVEKLVTVIEMRSKIFRWLI